MLGSGIYDAAIYTPVSGFAGTDSFTYKVCDNQNFQQSYDAVNRLTARSAPNGVTTSYAYDGLNRLSDLTHTAGAATLIGNHYQYNDANNMTSWANASGNHAYGYDAVDRLTSATNSAQPSENYSYDSVGNRTASHLSASYAYQPFNKLTSTITGSYTYDNNGNLISRTDSLGTTTFSWNEENQLTQVSLPSGLTVSYKYDGLGRRIQRTTSAGADERYVYDGADVLVDLNADWSVATYLNGPGIDNHLRQTSATTGVRVANSDSGPSASRLYFNPTAALLVWRKVTDTYPVLFRRIRAPHQVRCQERLQERLKPPTSQVCPPSRATNKSDKHAANAIPTT
jgi:YD repeat-containing protein